MTCNPASVGVRRRKLLAAAGATYLASGLCQSRVMAAGAVGDIPRSITPRSHDDYESWRQSMVWQKAKPDRFPAGIAQAGSIDDVRQALRYARNEGLRVVPRCGGHNLCGAVLRDNTLLLDVSAFNSLSIDPAQGKADVGPMVSGWEFLAALHPHGLAFPAPHCGDVPFGGFLLGGGLGWNGEAWGEMACFNVSAVDIMTPLGEHITATARENPDWFWLARGAGAGFPGVVTRYELQLQPLPHAMRNSLYTWDLHMAGEVAVWLEELGRTLPLNVELLTVFATMTEPGQAPRQVFMLSATAFAESEMQARDLLSQLAAGKVVAQCLSKTEFQDSPFNLLFEWDAGSFPWARWAADNLWTDAPAAEVVTQLQQQYRLSASPRTTAICLLTRGPKRYPDAAFSMKGNTYVACYANWDDPAEDPVNIRWVDNTMQALQPFAKGHYINEANIVAHPGKTRDCFSRAALGRIGQLRRQFDPDGVFFDIFPA